MKSRVPRTAAWAAVPMIVLGLVAAHPATASQPSPNRLNTNHEASQLHLVKVRADKSNVYLLKLKVSDFEFNPVVAHNQMDGSREILSTMSRRTHALAGINTDVFWWRWQTPPRGGFVRNGVVGKTPDIDHEANLYFTSAGKAYIGRAPYTITVNGRPIRAINDIRAIYKRQLTELTLTHASTWLPRGCDVVMLHAATKTVSHKTVHGYTVVSVQQAQHFAALRTATSRAIIACSARDVAWVEQNMTPHAWVDLHFAWQVPALGNAHITALSSGVSVLVRAGKDYDDQSRTFRTTGRNPETFACVSRNKTHLLLGVIDGRSRTSAGMTYSQVRSFMEEQHCWTGILFDGGGSTEMVLHNKVVNDPSDGNERLIASGLFIYRKPATNP